MSIIKPEEVSKDDTEKILKTLNRIKSAEELADIIEIPGTPDVGVKIATEILEHRKQNGMFTNLKQINAVPNIGPKRFSYIIESLRNYNPPHELTISEDSMQFRSSARAPVLSYEIPSPSSYEGRNYIEIGLDPEKVSFNAKATESVPLEHYLESNKELIFEYLLNASKEELEKQIYIVFDLEATVAEPEVTVYNGTYTFKDGNLNGWSTKLTRVKVEDSKDGHNRIAALMPEKGWAHIQNDFGVKTAGTIEFWVYFTGNDLVNWWQQIRFYDGATFIGCLYALGANLKWYFGTTSTVLIDNDCLEKWVHLKISWNGNILNIQSLGKNQKITQLWSGHSQVSHIRFATAHHQEVFVDAVGYSWDPNYNIGDNLGKSTYNVDRQTVDPEIINAIETLDVTSLKQKYDIFKKLIKAAITAKEKRIPIFSKTMGGNTKLRWMKSATIRPRIYFIETYKLTNFPGDYGPGRLIKTFSLMPGEETEISVNTWKKSTSTSKEASSILDSYTEEKADEFESNIQKEASQSDKLEESDTFNVHASAKVTLSVVNVDAGFKYDKSTKSSRESLAKNVSNVTSKHAQNASSKREVSIETSYEKTEESGSEISIVRRVENLNVSRTLNFVFHQMNQQFHSLMHLTDLKLAFFNGFPGNMKEYELYELIDLVNDYSNEPLKAYDHIYQKILKEYGEDQIKDNLGNDRTLVKEITIPESAKEEKDIEYRYLRSISPEEEDGVSNYVMREETDKHPLEMRIVNGIIIGASIVTMRTDGVVVEALLGESNALDEYSVQYREEKIRNRRFIANNLKVESDKANLGLKIINQYLDEGKIDKAAQYYREFFGVGEGLKQVRDILGPQILELESKKLSNI